MLGLVAKQNFIVRVRLVQQVSVSNENGSKIVDGRKCHCKPDAAATLGTIRKPIL